jgi:hypothetical protein
MNELKSKLKPGAVEFQIGLFADQEAALPAGAVKQESFGKTMKKNYSRERQYQKTKADNTRLQRQWENSAPARHLEQEKLRAQNARLAAMEPQTVTLVSCVSLKADHAAPARELYISDWFKKARIYAENSGDGWFILSALYGLVNPDDTIEPYNFTLNNQRSQERQAWTQRVAVDLRRRVPPKSRIVILAGENYRRHLIPLLEDVYEIETPMTGLGIGQQLAFLKRANEEFNRQ